MLMGVAQTWVVIGIFGAFAASVLGMMWSRLDRLDAKIDLLGSSLRSEIGGLRDEMHSQIGGLRDEMHSEIGGLRDEMHSEIGGLRDEMHSMAQHQAAMAGEQGVLRSMAHTHTSL